MKRNPYYRLQYIAGVPYLLAFGQANADYKRDHRLNETGAFLWEQMCDEPDLSTLITRCAEHFQCPAEQYSMLKESVTGFVYSLYGAGVLLPEDDLYREFPLYKTLEIAGLFCKLYGPAAAFSEELSCFETTKEIPGNAPIQHIHIRISAGTHTENGELILRNKELSIVAKDDKYLLFFPSGRYIKEVHISKDGQKVSLFISPGINADAALEISYAFRIAFLYFAQLHHMLAIHSASILYEGKIWLFSAPSGTGKSTHAQLWKQLYDVPIINGDLNLISVNQGVPEVRGIPWCGTSEIFSTKTYPLGGIIFLKQGADNEITRLSEDSKQLCILHRSISPSWTGKLQEMNYDVVNSFADSIFVCRLICTPRDEAVICIKEAIDAFLDKK